jgi:phosphatidylglycerophosphate synthase
MPVGVRSRLVSTSTLPSATSDAGTSLFRRSRKQQPATELLCEYVFRPLAHAFVVVLAPLRVPPPAVVLAGMCVGFAAATEIARGQLVVAAALLQLKTVLDNADGQLARATGRASVVGRYLDSESDLLVDAAVFAGIGYWTGEPMLAGAAFALLTLVVSANFNLKELRRREMHGPGAAASGEAPLLERAYALLYGWQDRVAQALVERRLRGLDRAQRLAYHDVATLRVVANFGLSTQLAVLGLCLAVGRPNAYLVWACACAIATAALWLRRDLRAMRTLSANREETHWIAER